MRSVDSESESHAIERRKSQSWEPLHLGVQGPRCCTRAVWCKQSCRRRMGTCANGQSWLPRNLGEPRSLLGEFPAGDTGLPTPGLGGALVRQGAKQRVQPRYRQAKETKCGGMAAGRRSALIVLMKQGNLPWRTLWRKAKRRSTDLVEGNMPNTSRFTSMSTLLD